MATPKKSEALPSYKALVGMSYPDPKKPGDEKSIEAGDVVSDLPPTSLPWLLEQNLVEEV